MRLYKAWSAAGPSTTSSPPVCRFLCSCSADKRGQPDQKPTNGFLGGLSETTLEIPYCHALRVTIGIWLALVKFGDLTGKGKHAVGLITLSSAFLLVLSGKKTSGPYSVFNVQRRLILLQRQNLQWPTACVLGFFSHLQCINEKEKELVEQGSWWSHL